MEPILEASNIVKVLGSACGQACEGEIAEADTARPASGGG